MVASKYSVLLDTNILMSKTLRDWILLLAVKSEYEFFTPHVSSGIMDEFGYHVRRANPAISDVVLENWKQQIIRSCISCISGFPVEAPVSFPDTDDLHVHAAAQHGAMHALVTDDRKLLDYQESYARSKGFTEIDIPRALERAGAGQFARYLRTVVINSPQFVDFEREFKAQSSSN